MQRCDPKSDIFQAHYILTSCVTVSSALVAFVWEILALREYRRLSGLIKKKAKAEAKLLGKHDFIGILSSRVFTISPDLVYALLQVFLQSVIAVHFMVMSVATVTESAQLTSLGLFAYEIFGFIVLICGPASLLATRQVIGP